MKALWVFALILFPYITAFVYLIARGKGMHERALRQQAGAPGGRGLHPRGGPHRPRSAASTVD
jgi:hypothetical protein